MLTAQAMGLGSWIHAAIGEPALLGHPSTCPQGRASWPGIRIPHAPVFAAGLAALGNLFTSSALASGRFARLPSRALSAVCRRHGHGSRQSDRAQIREIGWTIPTTIHLRSDVPQWVVGAIRSGSTQIRRRDNRLRQGCVPVHSPCASPVPSTLRRDVLSRSVATVPLLERGILRFPL